MLTRANGNANRNLEVGCHRGKKTNAWVCAPCVHCGLPCANFSKFIRHAVNAKSGPNSANFGSNNIRIFEGFYDKDYP